MKTQASFVRSNSVVVLHTVTSLYSYITIVVFPPNALVFTSAANAVIVQREKRFQTAGIIVLRRVATSARSASAAMASEMLPSSVWMRRI